LAYLSYFCYDWNPRRIFQLIYFQPTNLEVVSDPTTLAQNLAEHTRGRPKSPTLPYWPDATRGTPNSFLRGSLFAAIQGKDRRYLLREYGHTTFESMTS
jgi:hypothetical protein